MAEILTESFCERCGTRYTFESAPSKPRPLAALGTFGRGLKHFVASPENSFDESLAIARSEQEQRSTNLQLEAFHKTFNFCLSCRQYTCADCWNPVEGRCLSCAPVPEAIAEIVVDAPAELPNADTLTAAAWQLDAVQPDVDLSSAAMDGWTKSDEPEPLAIDEPTPLPEPVPEPEPTPLPEPLPEPEPVAAVADTGVEAPTGPAEAESVATEGEPVGAHELEWAAEPVAVEELEAAAEPLEAEELEAAAGPLEAETGDAELVADTAPVESEPAFEAEPDAEAPPAFEAEAEDVAAAPGTFVPGHSLDDEIAAYELRIAALAELPTEPGPEPVAVQAPEPEPEAEPEAEPEPVPEPTISATPITMPEAPQPTIQQPALDLPVAPEPPAAPHPAFIAASRTSPEPRIQARLDSTPSSLGNLVAPDVPPDTTGSPTLATCSSCGLSLSASARFCRRCGTRQHE